MAEILSANGIAENQIVSILFSLTEDLTAANPAAGLTGNRLCRDPFSARRRRGSRPRRPAARDPCPGHLGLPERRHPVPVYLDGAEVLRRTWTPFAERSSLVAARQPRVSGAPSVWHVTREYAGFRRGRRRQGRRARAGRGARARRRAGDGRHAPVRLHASGKSPRDRRRPGSPCRCRTRTDRTRSSTSRCMSSRQSGKEFGSCWWPLPGTRRSATSTRTPRRTRRNTIGERRARGTGTLTSST